LAGSCNRDVHRHSTGRAEVGLIDLRVRHRRNRAEGGHEIQTAIQQSASLEGGRLSDAVDGFQRRVNLQLIGRQLLFAQRTRVGRFYDQTTDVVQ
jgi:hypothetical protein